MGYSLTTEPENAVPGKSWVMPKTHTPGSPVKERGYRYYQPEAGRWASRDPVVEKGFRQTDPFAARQADLSEEVIDDDLDALLLLARDAKVLSRKNAADVIRSLKRRFNDIRKEHSFNNVELNLYVFVRNDGVTHFDMLGLKCVPLGRKWKACCGKECAWDPDPDPDDPPDPYPWSKCSKKDEPKWPETDDKPAFCCFIRVF